MPMYQVLRCAQCEAFQMQQVKKVPQWNCITCGTKQSVKKIYAESTHTGELRKVVMDYNMKRGQMEAERSKQAAIAAHPAMRDNVPEVAQLSSSTMKMLESHAKASSIAPEPVKASPKPETQYPPHSPQVPSNPASVAYYAQAAPLKPHESLIPVSSATQPAKATSPFATPPTSSGFVSPFASASTSSMAYTSSLASAKIQIIEEGRK